MSFSLEFLVLRSDFASFGRKKKTKQKLRMAISEDHWSQNATISLVLYIICDGLFEDQSMRSSKELLYFKNLVHAHSTFNDTSAEKRRDMKERPQMQAYVYICMFHQTSVSVAPNALY